MKEDIENTSNSSKETRNVFIGAKVTPTQKGVYKINGYPMRYDHK